MEWSKLSMPERAKYIRLGVKNGITDIDSIRKIYNKYAKGGHIYDGETEDTQQMERVNYYDPITGENYGSTMPEGKVRVRRFEDLTEQAQDEYMQSRATDLPDLIVSSGPSFKDTIQGIFSEENWNDHKGELKEFASYLPYAGEAIDAYDLGSALYRKEYSKAGLIAAEMFLPETIMKGGKWLKNKAIDFLQTKTGAKP